MIRLQVNPVSVWGFYPSQGIAKDLLEYIEKNGWTNIPPVPVFRIPDFEEFERQHEYALLDGNKRRDIAELRKEPLPVALYEPEEIIDFRKDGLAESRNLVHPKRYEILMQAYLAERRGLKAEIDRKIFTRRQS